MAHRRLNVITIPSADKVFREAVHRAVDVTSVPSLLEERLRVAYPSARVTPRELSGEVPSCYVYRDGRFIPTTT